MARTVDPQRHAARRLLIIDAALTCFAAHGVDGATTAAICRRAGIGSGTFFHYFPTKLAVLVALLDLGTTETRAWFASRPADAAPLEVVLDHLAHTADECADPRVPGFVRAVGAVMGDPAVAAALRADEDAVHAGLLPLVRAGQAAGTIRADVPADRLVTWLAVLVDGFLGRLAGERPFDASEEREMLLDTGRRLLHPGTP